mgnify:CR=1 FL=1
MVKIIIKDAFPFLLISCGTLILVEMDSFMLGLLQSSEEVAAYSIAKKFCSKASHINIAICTSTMPIFANLKSSNVDSLSDKFKKIMSTNIVLTFGVSALFVFVVPNTCTQ